MGCQVGNLPKGDKSVQPRGDRNPNPPSVSPCVALAQFNSLVHRKTVDPEKPKALLEECNDLFLDSLPTVISLDRGVVLAIPSTCHQVF